MNKRTSILYLLTLSLFFTSCIKDEVKDLQDEGNTFVKLLEAPVNVLFFSPFSEIRKVDLFSVRRDANKSAELQTSNSIVLRRDDTMIDDYNNTNGTTFAPLPDSLYTIANAAVSVSGMDYTFNFSPGDFAQELTINLNGAKWDLAEKYALAFKISNADGRAVTSGKDNVIVLISIKNKWDGVYEITGSYVDATNAVWSGVYPYEWELQTLSATSCVVVDNVYLGIPGFVFNTGTGLSYYGSFGLIVNFDPNTDVITSVINYYGQPAGNGRYASLDPTGINSYDANTKSIDIKYFMHQPSVIPTPPHVRASFNEHWKYIRSR